MKKLISFFAIIAALGISFVQAQGEFGEPEVFPKTKNLKVAFFSPLGGHLGLGYEQLLQPGITIDGRVGIIGVGVEEAANDNSGVYFGAGPKFLLGQDWHLEGMRQRHPLRGTYFKPEVIFSYFSNNDVDNTSNTPQSRKSYSGAVLLNFGKQWIVADILSLNLSAGLGYGFARERERIEFPGGTTEATTNVGGWFYSHVNGPNEFPIAFNTSFTVGFLIR